MLEHLVEIFLDTLIPVCELMGICVVAVSTGIAFWHYCKGLLTKTQWDVKFDLASGLALSLEFKMAAEILKTVLIHTIDELKVLGTVVILRSLLSLLIHFEIRHGKSRA